VDACTVTAPDAISAFAVPNTIAARVGKIERTWETLQVGDRSTLQNHRTKRVRSLARKTSSVVLTIDSDTRLSNRCTNFG